MKKYIALFIIIASLTACEKDDFCTQNPVTPNLVLRFYDKDNTNDLKNAERLSVIAEGKTDSLFTNRTTDSIAIPLNSLSQKTVYTLKMNNVDGNVANNQTATLTIEYIPEDDYVSRSCGFRVIFEDVNLSHSGWISSLSTNQIPLIDNQASAHVQVFH
ncbi:DUF6452 family protein [Tenacibaculum caenipelagi]|uniref:Ig-like domain-containing protein n=1 Tax=Tenacibaculum caenipelagi TaxID=1325435 RepID=A0A4R6TI61_9FLAO|nr:DUF6452 family protein [Tenacibaculum caenipelagi]TDQ29791.1 hypothetical protein DFQ07_0111 [Tenacibaculum caenipelagi]